MCCPSSATSTDGHILPFLFGSSTISTLPKTSSVCSKKGLSFGEWLVTTAGVQCSHHSHGHTDQHTLLGPIQGHNPALAPALSTRHMLIFTFGARVMPHLVICSQPVCLHRFHLPGCFSRPIFNWPYLLSQTTSKTPSCLLVSLGAAPSRLRLAQVPGQKDFTSQPSNT